MTPPRICVAHDGSRLVPTHPEQDDLSDLVKALLDLNADPNKPFVGALHSTTLCCGATINSFAVLPRSAGG